MNNIFRILVACSVTAIFSSGVMAQDILPPAPEWSGKSETLVAKKGDPWITPVESSGFVNTPSYRETMDWLQKLCASTTTMRMVSIGKSANGRDIQLLVATSDGKFDAQSIASSARPVVLMQAGIHAGEIDGKDAGMMLLRDIA
ncbi:MAG TPA: M14 family zinc carboxypeptidase, partial [Chryseosolibacter sp.]|nr:M14 family zinc carboxypeptidase [Chryseosolibacter sp.]